MIHNGVIISRMHSFTAELKIIGVNPYVSVPAEILASIFTSAGKSKGPIPVSGDVNGVAYTQTLVRYAGEWRFYINTKMLKNSPKRIGETLAITIDYDSADRSLVIHPQLQHALEQNPRAKQVFDSLAPSLRHEINRYISGLKSSAKVDENVRRAIDFLEGRGRFVGRELR